MTQPTSFVKRAWGRANPVVGLLLMLAVGGLGIAPSTQPVLSTSPTETLAAPPSELNTSCYYAKCGYCCGFPILASSKVDDQAVRMVIETFGNILKTVPAETVALLQREHFHYSIIGKDEGQTDLPEYWDLKNDPKTDWNKRARGLGGLPVASGGEENILELPSDRYRGESIYIHEFAHTLDNVFDLADPPRRAKLNAVFKKAISAGLWKNTYAASNPAEYYAEGVQSYFDCNRAAIPSNGIHNHVNTRDALRQYDPELFGIIDRDFAGNAWRYPGKYARSKPVTTSTTKQI